MKLIKFLLLGIGFGIIMTKSEVISWYRIYEMFRFESFHMYGIIGSAVVLGAIFVAIAKRKNMKSVTGEPLQLRDYKKGWIGYLVGGTIFGLGWAMTGACPGPLFVLVGNGFSVILVAIAAALVGTLAYGILRDKLPH
jgi:uncharacterized membrane protein YedE/YeeE